MPNPRTRVLMNRYFLKDENGNVMEDEDGMFSRVARAICEGEFGNGNRYGLAVDDVKDLMKSGRFLPNTPTLVNAGRHKNLSACFVIPVEDSIDGIFEAVKIGAKIHQTGGGTGYSFTKIRPKGTKVKTTGGEASGVLSFMSVFNQATETIKQGGVRRGANMGVLSVHHPEIMDFITSKRDKTQLTNFNISVAVTREFMDAVEHGEDYIQFHPAFGEREVDAWEVWNALVECAWESGEPGIIFIDEINEWNPTPSLGDFESTNPCGEQPLLPYESCNLGSINLSKYVTDDGDIDWDSLRNHTGKAVRILNAIIDINRFPIEKIKKATMYTRKIGLGVMGFADMLLKLGIRYDSVDAVTLAERVMAHIQFWAYMESAILAEEWGSYPVCDKGYILNFIDIQEEDWKEAGIDEDDIGILKEKVKRHGLHNATLTTIAPTGSISLIAECSSGIEPVFAFEMEHRGLDGQVGKIIHPLYKHYKEQGLDMRHFVTSHDVAPEWHIRMQKAFQLFTDNAVSKTVNLPNSATKEDVANVFMDAYQIGLKGITIYRDGSRENVLVDATEKKNIVLYDDIEELLNNEELIMSKLDEYETDDDGIE